MIGIYKITCWANGKVYIGATHNSHKRFEKHKWMLRHNKHHNCELQESWNLFGEENFSFEMIKECFEEDKFDEETKILAELGWPDRTLIFNFESGGIKNKHISPITKRKISIFNKGKHLSDEQKHKLRVAKLGKPGRKLTESEKKVISERMKRFKIKDTSIKAIQESNIKRQKQIIQMDLHGNIIKTWDGINQAARATNSQASLIHKCCNGQRSKHNGYIWKYKKDAI